MSIFDGLGKFGLGDLAESNLFEEEKKNEENAKGGATATKTPEEIEAEMLLDKKYKCPQCDKEFTSKVVRSGKAKPIGQDVDLRTKYENIDCTKYDVIMCPNCGYAALPRFFNGCTPPQLKLIKDNISLKFQKKEYTGAIYTYDEALERYQMALINALVKKGKASEKAFICLKSSWVIRGKIESLDPEKDAEEIKKLQAQEKEFVKNAFDGFANARSSESYPMCGMDEYTIDYLIAVLAMKNEKYDIAMRMLGGVITARTVNKRLKEKAQDLKEEIVKETKAHEA